MRRGPAADAPLEVVHDEGVVLEAQQQLALDAQGAAPASGSEDRAAERRLRRTPAREVGDGRDHVELAGHARVDARLEPGREDQAGDVVVGRGVLARSVAGSTDVIRRQDEDRRVEVSGAARALEELPERPVRVRDAVPVAPLVGVGGNLSHSGAGQAYGVWVVAV